MRIGILCGGGPAPGFNGVIEAVVLAAAQRGWTVLGIPDGFRGLMAGETDRVAELGPAAVDGIALRGGGILGTARDNPRKDAQAMANVVAAVSRLRLDALVTIGGDDTATSAAAVAQQARLRVAHIPKTIDNDLPLPGEAPTFGFETARQLGAALCANLRADARTTGRWYLVSAMGRSAGHLAAGMAMGSLADLCVIREEFEGRDPIRLDDVADLVDAAIQHREAQGQRWGLAVLAEGILERLDPQQLKQAIGSLELDEHGNPRMSEVDLGRAVRDVLVRRHRAEGRKVGFITKIIGYELRCADPCAADVQYTRALGVGAVRFLAEGEGDALVTVHEGRYRFLPLAGLRDPATGKVPVRRVDLGGDMWKACLALQARSTRPAP